MKIKKVKLFRGKPESFNNLLWFKGYTPKEIAYLAEQNQLCCMTYVGSTPIKYALFFHVKNKFDA